MHEYLLTYQNKEGKTDFAWFETEEELFDFTDTDECSNIIDAIKINDAEDLINND